MNLHIGVVAEPDLVSEHLNPGNRLRPPDYLAYFTFVVHSVFVASEIVELIADLSDAVESLVHENEETRFQDKPVPDCNATTL